MNAPRKFVCWEPSEDCGPELITAHTAGDAAKLFVLRDQAKAMRHDNGWTPNSVLVVDDVGDVEWFTVRVTVDLIGEEEQP